MFFKGTGPSPITCGYKHYVSVFFISPTSLSRVFSLEVFFPSSVLWTNVLKGPEWMLSENFWIKKYYLKNVGKKYCNSWGKKKDQRSLCQGAKAVDRNHGLTVEAVHSCSVDTPVFSLFLSVTDACRIRSRSNTVSNRWETMQMSLVLSAITSSSLIGHWPDASVLGR